MKKIILNIRKRLSSNKILGFSLLELMISLIVITMIASAVAPVVTKKLTSNTIAFKSSLSGLSMDCAGIDPGCTICNKKSCLLCASEYYIKNKKCEPCSRDFPHSRSCTANGPSTVDPGYYIEDEEIKICPIGHYCKGGTDDKKVCPDGKTTTKEGQVECIDCPSGSACSNGEVNEIKPGTYIEDNVTRDCPIGYFCIDGVKEACQEGYYSDTTGSSFCKPCQKGYYSDTTGSSTCTACQKGYYSGTTGSSACTACQKGYYSNTTGSSACSAITATNCYETSTTENKCISCNAGYKFNSGVCSACSAGTYSSDGTTSSTCTSINASHCYTTSTTENKCTSCEAGYWLYNGVCKACSAGTYSSNGTTSSTCTPITATNCYTTSPTENKCTSCNAGYKFNNGVCSECDAGTYSTAGTTSSTCTPITVSHCFAKSTTENKCINCEAGYKFNNGKCDETCANGTYSSNGSTSCYASTVVPNCKTYSTKSNACTACNTGYNLSAGSCASVSCNCPNGSCATGQSTCNACNDGYELNSTKTECVQGRIKITSQADCDRYAPPVNGNSPTAYFTTKEGVGFCAYKYNVGDTNWGGPALGSQAVRMSATESCTSTNSRNYKCCWAGHNYYGRSDSDIQWTQYGGQNRTACQYNAAKNSCEEWSPTGSAFNTKGKWHLYSSDELTAIRSISNDNGLRTVLTCKSGYGGNSDPDVPNICGVNANVKTRVETCKGSTSLDFGLSDGTLIVACDWSMGGEATWYNPWEDVIGSTTSTVKKYGMHYRCAISNEKK